MRLLIAILVVFTAIAILTDTRSNAGEWQEKPVMCAEEMEIFSMLEDKNETLVFGGNLLGKVRDPDEGDGLSNTPAILPMGLYVNFETKTFTILEYHGDPYHVFCVIGYGVDLQLTQLGDPT